MNTSCMFSSKSDLWETPQDFFDELNREFHFNLDVCAMPENAKCASYFTPEQDGLQKNWGGVQRLVQSSLWPADRRVGQKGRRERRALPSFISPCVVKGKEYREPASHNEHSHHLPSARAYESRARAQAQPCGSSK